jgi:hypothetical protein
MRVPTTVERFLWFKGLGNFHAQGGEARNYLKENKYAVVVVRETSNRAGYGTIVCFFSLST